MLLPILLAIVAVFALALVCWPLLRGARGIAERGQFDRGVYRDQLLDIERDLARGVINEEEARSARLEIQRRLLAVDSGARGAMFISGRSLRLSGVVAALILLGAGAGYWWLGAASLPDAPYALQVAQRSEQPPPMQHLDMQDAAARLEQKLRSEPSNGEAWLMFARTTAMLGQWPKAADAYRRAIDLGQTAADVFAGYGEMLVLAANGIVPPAAHEAFTAALVRDPMNDVARYYLALADSQAGEAAKAIRAWQQLAADIEDDSPMRESIARAVAETARTSGIAAGPLPKGKPAPPGPTDAQMSAAAEMPEAQRDAMIRGMVAKLADHLQSEPDDLEGWLRLGRSYAVLGETDKSVDAYANAAKLRPGDPEIKLQAFRAMVAGLQPSDALPPRALALLREVASISPDQPEVLWYLGVDAARDGHADVARRNWTKLLSELAPGGEDSKLVKAALDALPGK
jgi:cytochrome c-type biogenesis protein CcmH